MNQTISKPAHLISTLNGLIEINRDAQKGFQEAAQRVIAQDIKTFCLEQSRSRAHFVEELQTRVLALGDEPENSGTVSGALRRGWMDLKAALGGSDHAILSVVEASEDRAASEYRKALARDLPLDVQDMVELQSRSVLQAHDKVRALRDSLQR